MIGFTGGDARKLDLPERFTPYGFTRDGASVYGAFEVNSARQLAVFSLEAINANQTPSLAVLLPSGVHSVAISPDGSRYAILASPRPPDALSGVHDVVEPDETSLYVVNADGTGGGWWCPALKTVADNGLSGTPIAWAPDGSAIAVLSQTPKIGFHEVRSYIDICRGTGVQHVAEIPTRLRGSSAAVSRIDRVRVGLPSVDLSAFRRSRLPRRRQRYRFRDRAGLGRSESPRDLRLERRRVHDRLDGHADQSLSRPDRRRGNHRLGEFHLDERRAADRLRRALARKKSRRRSPSSRRSRTSTP